MTVFSSNRLSFPLRDVRLGVIVQQVNLLDYFCHERVSFCLSLVSVTH